MPLMEDLTTEQVHALGAVFQEKARLQGHIADKVERERAIIEQVIVDTWLAVSGAVPFDAWVNPVVPVTVAEGLSDAEDAPDDDPSWGELGLALATLVTLLGGAAAVLIGLVAFGAGDWQAAVALTGGGYLAARWGWRSAIRFNHRHDPPTPDDEDVPDGE